MKVVYKLQARKAILRVADYIETLNTEGSGERWAKKISEKILSLANSRAQFAICKNPDLAKFNYSCYTYNDWVIAFRIKKDKFEVCRFLYGSRLQ